MQRVRLLPFTIAGVLLCTLFCAAGVWAALVKTDLIGGLGDFEQSAETKWQVITDAGWPIGVNIPTPDDSVATGWYRRTPATTIPGVNCIYRIEPGTGLLGSHSQYMALRACSSSVRASLGTGVAVNDSMHSKVHNGDTLTFRLDRIYMTGYNVPSGSSVSYDIRIYFSFPNAPDAIYWNYLKPSQTPFPAEVTAAVPPGATHATATVDIWTYGDIGLAEPGIHVDGARLYRKSAGNADYDVEQIPVPRTSPVSTFAYFNTPQDDPYDTAANSDSVTINQMDGLYILRLKYYNPNLKVYLYERTGGVSDGRDQGGNSSTYSNCPIFIKTVLASHLDWLYPWPAGWTPTLDSRPEWLRDIYCVYDPVDQYFYYAHMDEPSYQQEWGQSAAEIGGRYGADGIFVDGAEGVSSRPDLPIYRPPAEVQSFEHAVYPYLRQSGLQVVMNNAIGMLSTSPANIYFNPFWKTDATFTPALGYENNTPDTTPDVFFMEWAFFRHWPTNGVNINHYELNHWAGTLDNVDAITAWNRKLPASRRKSIVLQAVGIDRPEDPAAGLDGWVHFGLCSYLLAQNQYTTFTRDSLVGIDGPIDLSGVARLGAAVGNHGPLKSDNSLQMRIYRNGLVIVNGHPTLSATYRLQWPAIGENGAALPRGTVITLKPHTGRMFFFK